MSGVDSLSIIVWGTFAVLIATLIAIMIGLWVKLNRLRRKYLKMINGGKAENMEQLIAEIGERIDRLAAAADRHGRHLADIDEALKKMKSNIGVCRYNAFGERGYDLSFSIAIVNRELDGVVLTGIHGHDTMRMYAKPIENGGSKYALSPEEKEAIRRAKVG